MTTTPRTAQAGDICILLEPAPARVAHLDQLQHNLQAAFGGAVHRPVHLTCQRFHLANPSKQEDVINRLAARMQSTQPFPLVAEDLHQMDSPFWQKRLLRWQIYFSAPLQHMAALVEQTLEESAVQPHFPLRAGWQPTHVTALEQIPAVERADAQGRFGLPYHLFTVRRIRFSRIVGPQQFEILRELQLHGPPDGG